MGKSAGLLLRPERHLQRVSRQPMPQFNQERIWSYFQNEGCASFAAAGPRIESIARRLGRLLTDPRPLVLNIGVGGGHFERAALNCGWEVHALDPDPVAIERLASQGIHGHVGTIEAIPLADGSIDATVVSEVLEHLSETQRRNGLLQIARVLRPGGWLVGTVPYREELSAGEVVCPECGCRFHRWGHQVSFDRKSLRGELAKHFTVRRLLPWAFVTFADRGFSGKIKSLARLILARCGQPIAVPSLYFEAQKPPTG
jgi:SAM-dependent methyltransferase